MQTSAQVSQPATAIQEVAEAAAAAAAAAAQEAAAVVGSRTSATEAYQATRAVRSELRSQLDALVRQRHGLLRELEDHDVEGPATLGMQQRIVQIDGRIAQLDISIANADAAVAAAAAVPGAVVDPPFMPRNGPPEEIFFFIPVLFTFAMLPIVIAYARRLWRRGPAQAPALPSDLNDRLSRLEQLGETTALEVERIGEGQRFVTRLMSDARVVPLASHEVRD